MSSTTKLNKLLGGGGSEETDIDATAVLLHLIESKKISIDEVKDAAHAVKNDIDVIDLCDVNDEQQKDTAESTSADSTFNTEIIKADDEETVCDIESSEQAEETQIQITKPLFQKGDSVYAKWERSLEWFPGIILSYTSNDCKSRYGESRTYRIKFDDGDVGDCEDFHVFHRRDYHLNKRKESTWKGVKTDRDENSTDEWAKLVGWYVVTTVDGKTLTFSTLLQAMRAYDESVVKRKGCETKGSELNLPEDYPDLKATGEVDVNAVTPVTEAGVERKSKRRKIGVLDQNKTFSENETDVMMTEEQNGNTFVLPTDRSQPLRKSCLITRKQLACLTGGKVNKHQYGNPLNVRTPVTYCGGAAMATENGRVRHLCMKEEMNYSYPSNQNEQFVVYRRAPSHRGTQQRDVKLLIMAHPNHPPIPIFWEPSDQSGKPSDQSGSVVMYIGHWKIGHIEDLRDRTEMHLGCYRCAKIYFDFYRFDEHWEKVIRDSHDKTHEQIKELNLDKFQECV
eukprot:CAMPEP_0201686368 /NCGR_PEP_ID=MMETSP0578-20130828/842_1 /ASSEMBLY_ACC=CAM_ASM_000663 /TAXON_ID=267565 /ORGANISM="Skeletonema grethea, Strain CCMP 1804" /LENGTH=508 /DNA_ID=CAMNT_0048170417 /DNA_START=29 /DNA_END=1555 /DNA_ORIENTATION=-